MWQQGETVISYHRHEGYVHLANAPTNVDHAIQSRFVYESRLNSYIKRRVIITSASSSSEMIRFYLIKRPKIITNIGTWITKRFIHYGARINLLGFEHDSNQRVIWRKKKEMYEATTPFCLYLHGWRGYFFDQRKKEERVINVVGNVGPLPLVCSIILA